MADESGNRLLDREIDGETLSLMRERDLRDFTPIAFEDWESPKKERGYRIPHPRLHPPSLTAAFLVDVCGFSHLSVPDKTRWRIGFSYRGRVCEIADRRFGLDIFAETSENEAEEDFAAFITALVARLDKLRTKAARELFAPFARQQIKLGRVVVINHFHELQATYQYFRQQLESGYATIPSSVFDLPFQVPLSFLGEGRTVGHYLQATVVSFFSFLEHRLLLAAAFCELPDDFDLDQYARASWRDKLTFLGLPGGDQEANRAIADLSNLAVQHRNPFAHGGMDKGGSLFAVYHGGGGGAIPANLSAIQDRPYPRLLPAPTGIPALLTEIDRVEKWLEEGVLRFGYRWADGGLSVSFGTDTRKLYRDATRSDEAFDELMTEVAHREDDWANADG